MLRILLLFLFFTTAYALDGCTNDAANNYNSEADTDDGTCLYDCYCEVGTGNNDCTSPPPTAVHYTEFGNVEPDVSIQNKDDCLAIKDTVVTHAYGAEVTVTALHGNGDVTVGTYPYGCLIYYTASPLNVKVVWNNALNTETPIKCDAQSTSNWNCLQRHLPDSSCKCDVGEHYDGAACVACTGQTYTDTQQLQSAGAQECVVHSYCTTGKVVTSVGTAMADTVCDDPSCSVSDHSCDELRVGYSDKSCCS